MPQQNSSRPQDPPKLPNNPRIITRVIEEPKRCEEIHNSIEAAGPFRRQLPHIGAQVMERRSGASALRQGEQFLRIIDTVDSKGRLGQQMRMASLTARRIKNPRPDRQTKQLDYAASFRTIALRREDRTVFPEVMRIEIAFPPLARRSVAQKNTGSRYAPNTSSIAARIS